MSFFFFEKAGTCDDALVVMLNATALLNGCLFQIDENFQAFLFEFFGSFLRYAILAVLIVLL